MYIIHNSIIVLFVGTKWSYFFLKNIVLLAIYCNVTASLSSADMQFRKFHCFLNIVSNTIQNVPICFRQHSEIITNLARLFQQLMKKRVEFPIFSLLSNISFTHIPFYSTNIRIFNSGLVANKNILPISIFDSVMPFEVYTRSVHCTLVRCRSWTQC